MARDFSAFLSTPRVGLLLGNYNQLEILTSVAIKETLSTFAGKLITQILGTLIKAQV